MNKLSKEKKQQLILIVLAAGFLMAGLNYFLIGMQKDKIAELDRKIGSVHGKVEKADQMVKMVPRIRANLEASQKKLAAKEDGMAPLDKFNWIFMTMNPVILAHRLNLDDLSRDAELSNPTDPGLLPKFSYQTATFRVKVSGYYQDIGKLFADLENNFPYMRIQNPKLRPFESTGPVSGNQAGKRANSKTRDTEDSEKLSVEFKLVTLVKPIN